MKLGLTPEQVAERREGVGGTDAGRIMRGEWNRLWREKTGRVNPEDLSDNLAVQMGSFTEQLNHHWFEKMTGRKVIERNQLFTSRAHPFMRLNGDGLTIAKCGAPAYWDAKHLGRLTEVEIARYMPQMTHGAIVRDVEWWVLSCFIGNSKWEMVEQPVDPFFAAELVELEAEFWSYVERDVEPEDRVKVEPPKPLPKYRSLTIPVDNDDLLAAVVKQNNWVPELLPLIRTFGSTKPAADLHAITRDEIKRLVPDDVGTIVCGPWKYARDKAGAVRMSLAKEPGNG